MLGEQIAGAFQAVLALGERDGGSLGAAAGEGGDGWREVVAGGRSRLALGGSGSGGGRNGGRGEQKASA